MKASWRVCPHCETALDRKAVSFTHSFECPNCGERLKGEQSGEKLRIVAVFLVSALLTYAFGFRGLRFVIVLVLLLWLLGHAAWLIVNALLPPRIMVRSNDDPEINRCPKCGTDLGNRIDRTKPFKCPQCSESLRIRMGKGFSLLATGVVLWLFVGTPLASLIGYEFGSRGINLALLPIAVFLAGAAASGLVLKLVGSRIQRSRIDSVPSNPPSMFGPTELKLR